MYHIAFDFMGYRLHFSDFEVPVFRHLHRTPSQLHPNSLAFIRAFEMTATYLGFSLEIPLFFYAFHLQRSKLKASKFHCLAKRHLSGTGQRCHWAPLIGPDGRPALEDYSRFPLLWRKGHYLKPASDFVYSEQELSDEELANYEPLKTIVSGFPRKVYEDEDGNPLHDAAGAPTTKKSYIGTSNMSSIAVKLRKSKANKDKRQAAGLGTSSTTVPPPTPRGEDAETEGNRVEIVDLENVGERVEDGARPSKVSRVDETDASASGYVPSVVPRYVILLAMGSQELLKQKSVIVISDAEKTVMDNIGRKALKNELIDAIMHAFKLMEIASYLNGKECKYLEERDAAKDEATFFKQKLEQTKVNHVAYKEKYVLQAGLLTKLDEKEKEAARLTTEKGELEGQFASLVDEKKTLKEKIQELENRLCASVSAVDPEESLVDPNGEYNGFTRAALIAKIFELDSQQLDVAKSSFDNDVAQLMVLNPVMDLVTDGASELKEVHDGVIVSTTHDEN
ncbi:hypothetical protein TSUD_134910 [Trifolium subterraneum]|uniref:Uncharacterized protein n=1 Tax=Trifolium subterraneum TaxID=3900 RepID=A0A2Z6PJ38_TRISU|nr:hypothetical protein TSUD_134910 [Trifolium subterraneum]